MCLWCLNTAGRAAALVSVRPLTCPLLTTQPSSAPLPPAPGTCMDLVGGGWSADPEVLYSLLGLASAWLLCSRTAGLGAGGGQSLCSSSFPEGTGGHHHRGHSVKAWGARLDSGSLILSHTLRLGWSTLHRGFCLLDFCQQHPLAQGSLLSTTRASTGSPPLQSLPSCGSLALGFLSSGGGSSWAVMLRTSWGQCAPAQKSNSHNCFPLASALLITAGTPEHLPLPLGPGQMLHRDCAAFSSPVSVIVYPRFRAQGDVAWWGCSSSGPLPA